MSTSQQSRWRLFEDESKYVDRFGLLLVVIVVAVVTLSLVDLSSDSDSIISEIGIVFVTLIVGATLLLAFVRLALERGFCLWPISQSGSVSAQRL